MPRTAKPHVVWLHVNFLDHPQQRVWAIQTRGRYIATRRLDVRIPLTTVFRGLTNRRQPRAYLRGRGVVRRRAGGLVITDA